MSMKMLSKTRLQRMVQDDFTNGQQWDGVSDSDIQGTINYLIEFADRLRAEQVRRLHQRRADEHLRQVCEGCGEPVHNGRCK